MANAPTGVTALEQCFEQCEDSAMALPRLSTLALVVALAVGCERSEPKPKSPPPEPPPAPLASARPAVDAGPADAAGDAPPPELAFDPAALDVLAADARATDSAALVVIHDGKVVRDEWYSRRKDPIQTMSITKSVLSLTVGCLVDEKKLAVDDPVGRFYPEWHKGEHQGITVRHLLTHSSGIDEGKGTGVIYRSKSFVGLTLSSPQVNPPGTHFEYSNRGANLLAGVIAKAAGEPTEKVVARCLLRPLGIESYWWSKDKTGQVHGLAGLHLLPRDLAKIGELVLGEGEVDGQRVVSADWIRRSTAELAAVQPKNRRLGMMWWLLPEWSKRTLDEELFEEWRAGGVGEAFIEKVRPLSGKSYDSTVALVAALRERFGDPTLKEWNDTLYEQKLPDVHWSFGPIVGVYSEGTLGQFVVVVPRYRLVAVRMRRMPKDAKDKAVVEKNFPDFPARVLDLMRPVR
ncbi:MAG: serine hydrolase [Polyangiaceae bacterium]|nr:serine hydrolase [Polyangiaceae bacterium]